MPGYIWLILALIVDKHSFLAKTHTAKTFHILHNFIQDFPTLYALQYGKLEIFNTDQGCPFTSEEFTQVLIDNKITIRFKGLF